MKTSSWLTILNKADTDEILIQGPIGSSFWDDSGMSEKEFTDALKEIPVGRKITIGINSEGGSIKDGLGIYHAIKRRAADITTRVDGYAVSIASVIALAGSKVVSPKSSLWMIHEPWSMTVGNAEDHLKAAESLRQHAETLLGIYETETGQPRDVIRAAMKDETWFRGDEAVNWGLADEVSDQNAALNAIDLTKYRNPPKTLLRGLVAAHGAVEGSANTTQPTVTTMENKPPVAEPTNPPTTTTSTATAPPAVVDLGPVLAAINNINARIDGLSQQTVTTNADPIRATGAQVTREGLRDILSEHPLGKNRYEFLLNNWNALKDAGHPLQPHNLPVGANTDTASGVLTTAVLVSGVITKLQNKLAFLRAFNTFFEIDRIKPRAVVEVPLVLAGGTAQSNATNFEDTTNFVGEVDDVPITPAQITTGAHITNAELNNGWRMNWWLDVKMSEFATKLKALCNAVISTTNFTGDPVISAAAAFGSDELKTLWGSLKKSSIKNILLDGEYYARFLPADLESFNPLSTGTYPGWDNFLLDTHWTGATTNTVGFACHPQAICVAMGLPLSPPNAPGSANLTQTTVQVPGSAISAEISEWFATAARVSWWTVDVMFGAAKGDATAGFLIKSA